MKDLNVAQSILASVTITALEFDILNAIAISEYRSTENLRTPVWRFSPADNAKVAKRPQVPGILSSLSKKGLVYCDNSVRGEETVSLTELGVQTYKAELARLEKNGAKDVVAAPAEDSEDIQDRYEQEQEQRTGQQPRPDPVYAAPNAPAPEEWEEQIADRVAIANTMTRQLYVFKDDKRITSYEIQLQIIDPTLAPHLQVWTRIKASARDPQDLVRSVQRDFKRTLWIAMDEAQSTGKAIRTKMVVVAKGQLPDYEILALTF